MCKSKYKHAIDCDVTELTKSELKHALKQTKPKHRAGRKRFNAP